MKIFDIIDHATQIYKLGTIDIFHLFRLTLRSPSYLEFKLYHGLELVLALLADTQACNINFNFQAPRPNNTSSVF